MNREKCKADLLVTGKACYLQDDDRTLIPDGGVAICKDTIVATGPAADLATRFPGTPTLATEHGLIMPGLVNAHNHVPMSCFRGLAEDLPLDQWLQEYIFPAEAKLTGEMVYQATRLSLAEMIKSGTTSFCDMYPFAGDVAQAVEEAGMRAWLGEVFCDFPSPNYGDVEAGLRYVEELFTSYAGHPRITITVNPHAVYSCSPALLQKLKRTAECHNAFYVIHLAENRAEVEWTRKHYGTTPVLHLQNLGLLDNRLVANHCVALSETEIDLLARQGVGIVHCPESDMMLGSGIAKVPRMLVAGITVGLGTDGAASNNNLDMFGEMNAAAKTHKAAQLDPTVMAADTVLSMASCQGAGLLDAADTIGRLEPGKKADLIVLEMNKPHLTPLYSIPSQLVYGARGADVIHSVINGTIVMRDRQILTMNEEAILAAATDLARQIQSSTT